MKYSISQCYSCQQKVTHDRLNKELVQNKSVLLCNFCKGHFLKNGYIPQPLKFSVSTCTVCEISELDAYLYQAKSNKFSKKYCEKCFKVEYGEPDTAKKVSEVTHESVLKSLNNPPKRKNYFLFGGLSFLLLIMSVVFASNFATNYKASAEMKSEINTIRDIYKNILNPLNVIANSTNEQIENYLDDYGRHSLANYSEAIKPIQTIYHETAQLDGAYAKVAVHIDEQLDIIQSIHQFLLEPNSEAHSINELNKYLMDLQTASDRTLDEMNFVMDKKNIGYKYENNGIYFYSK